VQASIPSLLGGIRTAFWASLAGVAGALSLRFAQRFRQPKEVDADEEGIAQEVDLRDVVAELRVTRKEAQQHALAYSAAVEQQTARHDQLIAVVQGMGQEAAARSQALQEAFDHFAQHMVENNQKAVIEALKEVIRDFNSKLSEQFGENFKQLNTAVGQLLQWQQQYKDELNMLQREQQQGVASLGQAVRSLEAIAAQAGSLTQAASGFGTAMEQMTQQQHALDTQRQELVATLRQLSQATPAFAQAAQAMLEDLNQGIQGITQSVTKTVATLEADYQAINQRFATQLAEHAEQHQAALAKGLEEQVRVVKEGVLALDQALQKELTDALASLGGQLAALSRQFVDDYAPLTERLREVVAMARGTGRG
jgi:predicted  nucleic acid-binding Zn-ribbon protein